LKYLEIIIPLTVAFLLPKEDAGTDESKDKQRMPWVFYKLIELPSTFVLQMLIFQTDFFFTITLWTPLFLIILAGINVLVSLEFETTGIKTFQFAIASFIFTLSILFACYRKMLREVDLFTSLEEAL